MTRRWDDAAWIGGAFGAALAVGIVVLEVLGRGIRGVTIATESVARVAFLFFWLAYAGGALAHFFGSRFAALARRRRELGLAFATALAVHLTFVAWLFHISFFPPVPQFVVFYFGIGAAWAYAITLASLKRVRDLMGEIPWRIFTTFGIEYIALLFFRDFVLLPHVPGLRHTLFYAPFEILIIAGPLLRWSAAIAKNAAVPSDP
jgi:hypothetical protein